MNLFLYSISKVMQRLKKAWSYCAEWYIYHWSWWRRRLASFSWRHMWHEWQEWNWRDSHQSRYRKQKFSHWMWWSRVLLARRPLQKRESFTAGESHQHLFALWAVYQVRVPRLGINLRQPKIRMVGVTRWPGDELPGRSLAREQSTNLRMRHVQLLRKIQYSLQLRCQWLGMAWRQRSPHG